MNLFKTSALSLLVAAALAATSVSGTPAPETFAPTSSVATKVVVNSANTAGSPMIQVCPTGDCTVQDVKLVLASLKEVTNAGVLVRSLDVGTAVPAVDWSTFAIPTGANDDKTKSVSTFTLDGAAISDTDSTTTTGDTTATIALTAGVYVSDVNKTLSDGTIVTIPTGTLGFEVDLSDWTLKSTDNKVVLTMGISAISTSSALTASTFGLADLADATSDFSRLTYVSGLYMDAPKTANDTASSTTTTSTVTSVLADDESSISWTFSGFTALAYEPFVGTGLTVTPADESASATTGDGSAASVSALSVGVLSAAFTLLAALAF